MSKKNIKLYAFYSLLILIGLTISVGAIKMDILSNLFVFGILISVIPGLYRIFFDRELQKNRIFVLVLILLPILFIRYIYAIRFEMPTGFSDVQYHLFMTEKLLLQGNFDFPPRPSINFPGLYLFYVSSKFIMNSSITQLAAYMHPFVNFISVIFFYLFLRRLLDVQKALLATFIFGWEYVVFRFGFEYRTQSFAIVFLLALLYLLTKPYTTTSTKAERELKPPLRRSNLYLGEKILAFILISSILISHIVTFLVTLIFIIVILVVNSISFFFRDYNQVHISWSFILISVCLFFFYILYFGKSFNYIVSVILLMIKEFLANGFLSQTPRSTGLVGLTYGSFVLVYTWIFRVSFALLFLYFIKQEILKKKKRVSFIVCCWTLIFGGLTVFITITGALINPSRMYIWFMIPVSIVLAWGLIKIWKTPKFNKRYRILFRLFIIIFIVFFVITSVIKLPDYVASPKPFREHEERDDVKFSWLDNQDVEVASFLRSSLHNGTLRLDMVSPFYKDIEISDSLHKGIKNTNVYILLRDSYQGESFYYRSKFLPLEEYDREFNKIFTTDDFHLYMERECDIN